MTLKEAYNLIAEDWHKEHEWDDWSFKSTDFLIACLKPGSTVLDAGCGGGRTSKYLFRHGLKVVGIDLSEKMVGIARRENPEATFSVLDVRDVAALGRTFDAIMLQAVLLHLPKAEVLQVLRRLAEQLSPGGYFCISVKERKPDGPEEEIKKEDAYGYPYERFFSYYSVEECREWFSALGFEIVFEHVFSAGRARWIQMVAQKV